MLQAEIDETLNNFLKDDSYSVVESLKNTEFERTEKVYSSAKDKYFIRKYIRLDNSDWDNRRALYSLLIELEAAQVAKVFEIYNLADELVVIMEYIEGPSLYEYVVKSHPLPSEIIENLFGDILSATNSLHNLPGNIIIHRDITPSNIVIYQDERMRTRAKLIDFGIARVFTEEKTKDTQHLGTIGFAAPEQYGFGQTSVRSDIYALGAVLYFCLTGKNPSNNLLDILVLEEGIQHQMKALISKAMSIDPKMRHSNVDEFRSDFESKFVTRGIKGFIKKHIIREPVWSGPQRSTFARRSWNVFIGLIFALVVEVALFEPLILGIKGSAEVIDYLVNVVLILFLILPSFLLTLDIFGFYKRFKHFAKFSLISVILTVLVISFTLSVLLVGLLGQINSAAF